jgi:hypothetical protein
VRIAGVLAAAAVALGACGGDAGGDANERRTSDPPEEVVWYGIEKLGPDKAHLPPDQSRALAISFMGTQGIPVPEADCVLAVGVPLVGGDAGFAELTIVQVADFRKTARKATDDEAQKARLAACVSAESDARKKAGELAPDMDLVQARDLAAAGAEQNALAVGLTAEQARCYADGAYASLSADQVRGAITGQLDDSEWDRGAVVVDCLPSDRIDELALQFETELLQRQADRRKEEQDFQDEVDRLLASTTTVPPGQTTAPPTVPEGVVPPGG